MRPGRGSRPPPERTVPTAAPRSRQAVRYCGVVNILAQACAIARSGDVRPGNVAQPPSEGGCPAGFKSGAGFFGIMLYSSRFAALCKLMTVYVADIKGRGVVAFSADSGADAERLVRDRVFRDDLMALASGGLPLWDGVTDIQVRQARPDEEARWRASHANAIRRGDIETGEPAWLAFLVALTDPERRKR
jgi:hypothetical protein